MINTLLELNEKIVLFANYIVKNACEETYSGSYNIELEEACEECNIDIADFTKYRRFFEDELNSREEILEINITETDIDVSCALDYCPCYEWDNGDEDIFGSFEGFMERYVKPYSQPTEPVCQINDSDIEEEFKGSIILAPGTMTVYELNREQLSELKQIMYIANTDDIPYEAITDIESLVSDEEVKEYYKTTLFTEDDFSVTSSKLFDKLLENARKRSNDNQIFHDVTSLKSSREF